MIYWLTGQPGAGKTTLANNLKDYIPKSIHIDGDDMRELFDNKDYSKKGRMKNIELTQKNLFENRNFSPEEFNKMFERDKKRRDKIIKKKQEKGEIVKFNEGFTAFNDVNANFVYATTSKKVGKYDEYPIGGQKYNQSHPPTITVLSGIGLRS